MFDPFYISSKKQPANNFTDNAIFNRTLLLAVSVAYALSFAADRMFQLHFNTFIFPAAGISFLLFGVFVISFFATNFWKYSKIIIYVLAILVSLHLTGSSIVNHFRPENLIAISTWVLIASFVFNLSVLILFDFLVCAFLTGGIYIDHYINEEFVSQHIAVTLPYFTPAFFFLIVIAVMIFTAWINFSIAFLKKKLKAARDKEPSLESFDEPLLLLNAFSDTIADCNEAAVKLFEATDKNYLINNSLELLFKEVRHDLLNQLSNKDISIVADFISQKGKIFRGVIHARTREQSGILRLSIFKIEGEAKYQTQTAGDEGHSSKLDFPQSAFFAVANIGLDYSFIKANAAFCELTGFSQQELKSIKLPDLIHPADREKEKQILSNLFSGRIPINRTEKRLIKKNQQIVWVNVSSVLQRDENGFPMFIVLTMENINRQKRYERTLIKDKTNLTSVLDNSDFYLVTVDQNNTILFLNEKLKDVLFGLTDVVIETGYNLKLIIPKSYQEQYAELFSRGMNGENFSIDINFKTASGTMMDIEISIHPLLDEFNHIFRLIISARDIREQKNKERELIKEKTQAEASTEAKSSFLATMSHEIRTPLNGVIGMGRLLNQTALSVKQQEYVNSILLSGEALLTVINDILDFSKIESEKMELEHKPFALKRCVEETFELLSAKAIEKNLSLQYSIQKDVPRYIIGDITRLRQVLLNLVSNAIKFTPQGKIVVHISRYSQSIATDSSVELLLEVKDTGIGIAPEKIDRLFKSFSQVEASTAKTYGGSGLGLAISKNLISLMGGTISVKSNPGEGSSFFFTIKTRTASADEIPDGARGASQLAKAKLLLVSDNKEDSNTYASYFKRWGMTVQTADNMITALQWIKEKEGIDLVAIDAGMISAKAITVAEKLRSLAPKEELPIVLFNATDDDITVEFTDKILSAVVPKNIDRSKLLDILISVFNLEDYQRSRQQRDIASTIGKQLAVDIPLNILIAEDNAINQKLVANIFEGLGYTPDIASNGLQVIDRLKKKSYDIIFMDVQMPELDGLETTRFIINKMNLSKRPIIVAMTAFALEGDREKCIEAGMDDYISKPFMIEEIVESIRKWGIKGQQSKSESRVTNQELKSDSHATDAGTQLLNRSALNRLRGLAAGDSEMFVRDIIKMFLKQGEELIDEIEKSNNDGQYLAMAQAAHKLKGSALNLGAEGLADVLQKIEIKGKSNNPSDSNVLIKEVKNIFEKTSAELKKI